ncbi:MAG: cold-shock protein, partial [Burkholderiales bacterium]
TFIPEKLYGFIKGHDGKDYFFSLNAFTDKQHRSLLYDGALVEFEATATPKGYKAIKCVLLDPAEIDTYIVPKDFQTSKSESIRGWDIIERGDWIIRTDSSDSLDDAKRQLIRRAQSVNANAITELEYLRDTGYSGNYQFTIHIFLGRPVVVAKKSPQGEHRKHDLCVLNRSAADMKQDYAARRIYSKDRRHLVSIFLVGI